MADITPFNFGTYAVRVITQNNQQWFAAADVCAALGIKNHRDSLMHLDDDEKGVVSTDTLGGTQNISVVNESGLYALVLRSRKPEARKFAKWVTSEVLPSIRQTGSYHTQPQATRTERAHQLATKATAQVFDTVFQAALRDDFHPVLDRLLLSIAPTDDATPQAVKLERDAIVTTIPHLIRAVASDLHISTADLTMLALACTQRLASRTPTATQGRLQI
ncbi:Bro-N domain-containing protein [Comamonas aquatica]|uniref:BRO-N domain-containing protein n=1 Tax=Comamonas aquatica TaxID=225991 RepID=UPI0028D4251A|nr:Bro-N domain-containing protein [Comamonas aquatica]